MAKQFLPRILLGLAIIAGLVWAIWFAPWQFGFNKAKYQAVFLTNGQVYFGKLVERGKVVMLSDIYYLQVQKPIQPAEAETQPDVKLIKLGREAHGPMDRMRLNREQILFVEDLREDGTVVDAIRRYERGDTSSVQPGSTTGTKK